MQALQPPTVNCELTTFARTKEIRMKTFRTMALTMTLAGSMLLWTSAAAAGQSRTL